MARKVVVRALRETIEIPEGHSFRIIRWARNLKEVEVILGNGSARRVAGEGIHWHHHPEMEMTWFRTGQGTRFVGDHIGSFEPEDLVLLGGNLPHYWHADGKSSGLSVQWHFPPGHPFWSFPENLEIAGGFRCAERGLRLSGDAARTMAACLERISQAKGALRLSALMELFSMVAAAKESEVEVLSSRSFGPGASRYQPAIAKAVRYLVANFREEVRLEDLLKLTGMSRPTFARQFKAHSGRSFSEFMNGIRLQAACRELAETDRSVLEISLDCGFNQISFFNRVFRREKGCSPREYRGGRN